MRFNMFIKIFFIFVGFVFLLLCLVSLISDFNWAVRNSFGKDEDEKDKEKEKKED